MSYFSIGNFNTNLTPNTSNTYDIGSNTNNWRNIYNTTLSNAGNASFTSNVVVAGTLSNTGNVSISGSTSFGNNVVVPGCSISSYTTTFSTSNNGVKDIVSFTGTTGIISFDISVITSGSAQTHVKNYKFAAGYYYTQSAWQRCIPLSYWNANSDAYELQIQTLGGQNVTKFRLVHSVPNVASQVTVNIMATYAQNDFITASNLTAGAEYTDSNWATYSNGATTVLTQTGGQVGIGTMTPGEMLDISGNMRLNSTAYKFYVGSTNAASNNGNLSEAWGLSYKSGDQLHPFRVEQTLAVGYENRGGSFGACNILLMGNIGFGMNTPSSKIDLGTNNQSYNQIGLYSGGTSNWFGFGTSNGAINYLSASNHIFYFGSSSNNAPGIQILTLTSNSANFSSNINTGGTITASNTVSGFASNYGADAFYGSTITNGATCYMSLRPDNSNGQAIRIGGTQISSSNSSHMILRFLTVGNAEYARFNSNSYLGLNQPNPTQQLDVNGSANISSNLTVSLSVNASNLSGNFSSNTFFNSFIGVGNSNPQNSIDITDQLNTPFQIQSYQNSDGVVMRLKRARGTATTPSNLLSGDCLTGIRAWGWNSNFVRTAQIDFFAAEDYKTGSNGSYISFQTTNSNSTIESEKMRIDPTGTLILYNSGLNTCNNNINAGTGVITGQLAWSNITSVPAYLSNNSTISQFTTSNFSIVSSFSNTGISTFTNLNNDINGSHIYFKSAAGNTSMQMLNYGNDNFGLNFDSYWDGNYWKSSSGTGSYQIYKFGGKLQFNSGLASNTSNINWQNSIVINSNGNVGIGTSNPNYTLDVTGTARVSTNMTVGGSLTVSNIVTTGNLLLSSNSSGSMGYTMSAGSNQLSLGLAGAAGNWSTPSVVGDAVLRSYYGNVYIQSSFSNAAIKVDTNNNTTVYNVLNTNTLSNTGNASFGGTGVFLNSLSAKNTITISGTSTYLDVTGTGSETRLYAHNDGHSYLQHSNNLYITNIGTTIPQVTISNDGTTTIASNLWVNSDLNVSGIVSASNTVFGYASNFGADAIYAGSTTNSLTCYMCLRPDNSNGHCVAYRW